MQTIEKRMDTKTEQKPTDLNSVVSILYLSDDNAVFTEKNGFISLQVKTVEENGEEKTNEYERVFLHRDFPFNMPYKYISVLDKESKEIGIIEDILLLSDGAKKILLSELERKYFMLKIKSIQKLKERYGFSYWDVVTDEGPLNFTLQDTFGSILKIGRGRLLIIDVDGNRYEIENVAELDSKSYKKIELYL